MDRVVHFEIPVDDLDRAKKFYSENFGWKLNQFGPEMDNYVLVHTGPTDDKGMPQDKAFINGGIMKRDPTASAPVLVIAVADADAAVEKVRKSGGRRIHRSVNRLAIWSARSWTFPTWAAMHESRTRRAT